MISVKNLSTGCLALIISTSAIFAEDTRKVAFRTLCLERVNDIGTVIIPGSGPESVQKVELYTDVSPVVEGVFANQEAAFYVEKGVGADGKPIRVLVGKAELGKSDRQLFLFTPGEKGEGKTPYNVRSFDDDTKSFPMGYVRVVNIAPVPVRFLLSGEVTPQIPPGKFAQFPHSKKVNDYNMYAVEVQFLSGNGQWVSGQSVSWKSTERLRDIVITSVDLRYKQPSVQAFSDLPPWMMPQVPPVKP
ncbi:MAG: hypothetical protein ABIS50_23770 [Luteolibacter sp.]|uniref:hypothetical protein n=1 Tax=Luteolibacter sp. TaxID=1962973 RepID=UPI003263C85E